MKCEICGKEVMPTTKCHYEIEDGDITADGVLFVLEKRFGIKISNTRTKALGLLHAWIKRGLIQGPKYFQGVEQTGGIRGFYDKETPLNIATIFLLRRDLNISLKKCAKLRIEEDELWNKYKTIAAN